MQSFLGLANYYRRFIRSYSKKKLKDRKLIYKPEIKEVFKQLKNALLNEPILIIYNLNKPLEIKTDSLDFAIGGQHYCLGSKYKVKVRTNHYNIIYFTKTQKLSTCQTHYFKTLSDFDYKLTHCEGTANRQADALSRKEEHFKEIPEIKAQILRKNYAGNYKQIQINTLFIVEEHNPILNKIREYVVNMDPELLPEEAIIEDSLLK
ncbi:hypothetical protein MKX08_003192 [Trichoderma sp. CBMAI-0020]|nr:hypothetical protein MKX08_003192 [Trichoderma sp. CBMAI-0020]